MHAAQETLQAESEICVYGGKLDRTCLDNAETGDSADVDAETADVVVLHPHWTLNVLESACVRIEGQRVVDRKSEIGVANSQKGG